MSNSTMIQEQRCMIGDATEFGRVAVMLGGDSSEREVSLDTGTAVLNALLSRGIDAQAWDPAEKSIGEFATAGFDRVWIALHGPGGEDGALQGALQWLNVPYTGSGVMASAIAMDKVRSKHLFRAAGIPTPEYAVAQSQAEASVAAEQIGFPLIVKPSGQGSSVGMSKVFERAELKNAVDVALQYGDTVLIECCINGDEFTVAVLQGHALPSIRIVTPRVFYDYRAKYESDRTEYVCKGTRDDVEERQYADLAIRNDEPLPGAYGGTRRRYRFRGIVLANPGNEFRDWRDSNRCRGGCPWHVSKPRDASRKQLVGYRCQKFDLADCWRQSLPLVSYSQLIR